MPSQSEVEYYKFIHQKCSLHKLSYSVLIGLGASFITLPLELLKIRSQCMSEGKRFNGYGAYKNNPLNSLALEVYDSGKKLKSFYVGSFTILTRSIVFSCSRTFIWCAIYNHYNIDPRRDRSISTSIFTNFFTGLIVGALINPIDIVYTRQAVDGLMPKDSKRNYNKLFTSIQAVSNERALFRGALSGGLSLGIFMGSLPRLYDFLKEYLNFFFGPTNWLRPLCLSTALLLSTTLSLPFDNIKTRMHISSPMPDGKMPYLNDLDCLFKSIKYDCNYKKYSSIAALHSGFMASFIRSFVSLMLGIKISDYAFSHNYKEADFIEPGNFYKTPYVKIFPHKPLTREDVNKRILDLEPTQEFKAYWKGNSSFKI